MTLLLTRAATSHSTALIVVSATRQKNVRQKNEEDQTCSSFFCLRFFYLAGLGGRNDI
jgi:hypothetical protein